MIETLQHSADVLGYLILLAIETLVLTGLIALIVWIARGCPGGGGVERHDSFHGGYRPRPSTPRPPAPPPVQPPRKEA